MRRRILVLTVFTLVLSGVACSKKLDTGFPPPAATKTISPSASASTPTEPVTAVTLVAKNIAFDMTQLLLKANEKITVTLDNQDGSVPHNFGIWTDPNRVDKEIYKPSEDVAGGAKFDYVVPALKAGKYYFECDIHKNMNGTVTVE